MAKDSHDDMHVSESLFVGLEHSPSIPYGQKPCSLACVFHEQAKSRQHPLSSVSPSPLTDRKEDLELLFFRWHYRPMLTMCSYLLHSHSAGKSHSRPYCRAYRHRFGTDQKGQS